jgi:hypothetical protein
MTDSQTKKIKKHLEDGKTITGIEALNDYNCFRLPARIYDLKQQGMNIQRENVRKGRDNKLVAEYRL